MAKVVGRVEASCDVIDEKVEGVVWCNVIWVQLHKVPNGCTPLDVLLEGVRRLTVPQRFDCPMIFENGDGKAVGLVVALHEEEGLCKFGWASQKPRPATHIVIQVAEEFDSGLHSP
jgi:hypothetical protein